MSEDINNGRQCRIVKNTNFTVMSNIHLRSKDLSLKAKGLMSLCLSLPENWDYSINGLVTLSCDGRDSVSNTLKELKKYGFLNVEKVRTDKGTFKIIYTFYENPAENQLYLNSIQNGFSDTVQPNRLNRIGSAESVNPIQINTNNKILKTNTKISLSKENEKQKNEITDRERKILIDFAIRKGKDIPEAYVRTIINNGDYKYILEKEEKRLQQANIPPPIENISEETAFNPDEIKTKEEAEEILKPYHNSLFKPPFYKFLMEKWNITPDRQS